MNDINEMPPKCQYCPYWEVCEYPWVCPDREQLATNLQQTCSATDTINRQAAIDAVDSETVSTNPEHFKSSEKFIKFMDDADIASFGKWQWANGFNTAVVAARIQLEKLPSAQSEPQWISCSERLPKNGYWLWSAKGGEVQKDFYWDGHWEHAEKYGYEVVAWMPLPESYKEDGK